MNDTQTQLDSIQEAYMGVITEGKDLESKFKVGDKVGIGYYHSSGLWTPDDTGTVKKIGNSGLNHVEHDTRKSYDNHVAPFEGKFRADGTAVFAATKRKIIPIETHNKHINDQKELQERTTDLNSISDAINMNRNGYGHHKKLSKEHVAHIKSLLDKHTEE